MQITDDKRKNFERSIEARKSGHFPKLSTGFNNIQVKLFMFFIVPIVAIITVLNLLTYRNVDYIIDDLHTTYLGQLIDNVRVNIDGNMTYVQKLVNTIILNDIVISQMETGELKDRFEIYKYKNNNFIDAIYLVDFNGVKIASKNVPVGRSEVTDELINIALNSDDHFFWIKPHDAFWDDATVISYFQKLMDEKGEFTGILVADMTLNKLGYSLSETQYGNSGKVYIVDGHGDAISFSHSYDKLNEDIKASIKPFFSEGNDMTKGRLTHIKSGDNKVVMISKAYNMFDWKLVGIIEENEILNSINSVKDYSVLMLLLIIGLSIVVTLVVTQYISAPIKHIAGIMNKVKGGNLHLKTEISRRDEIGYLATSFNDMSERISNLVDELKETENAKKIYELRMLQYQINPHFIYNTMNSINFMVSLGKTEKIQPTIESFINLLKASIDRIEYYIPIHEEITNIKNYIYIQKIRYQDKFDVKYKIEPEIEDYMTLKLILQPLVENAIFHGVQPAKQKGLIKINGYMESGNIIFEIIDNGVGMNEEQVKKLLKVNKEEQLDNNNKFCGIGLINVQERLRLYFGNTYGLNIKSARGEGTTIKMLIPTILKGGLASDGNDQGNDC